MVSFDATRILRELLVCLILRIDGCTCPRCLSLVLSEDSLQSSLVLRNLQCYTVECKKDRCFCESVASLRATEKTACSARLGLQRSLCARPAALGTKRLGASPDARTPGTLRLKFQGSGCKLAVGFKGSCCSKAVGCRVVGSEGCWVSGFRTTPAPSSVLGEREGREARGRDVTEIGGTGGQITGSPSLTGTFLLLGGGRRSGREPIFLGVSTSPHGILNLLKNFEELDNRTSSFVCF